MHPDQKLFLASQRIAALQDEAGRDRLVANARRRAADSSVGPATRRRHPLVEVVTRMLRLARPTPPPLATRIAADLEPRARTAHGLQ